MNFKQAYERDKRQQTTLIRNEKRWAFVVFVLYLFVH